MLDIRHSILFLFLFFAGCQAAQQEINNNDDVNLSETKTLTHSFPDPVNWVNDWENVLTSAQEDTLNKLINDYEIATTREIAVVSTADYGNYLNINEFATELANYWGVGKAETNNGVLIVYSNQQRETRITTGLGAEKELSDVQCKSIIENQMIPYFKEDDSYGGLKAGLTTIIEKWEF